MSRMQIIRRDFAGTEVELLQREDGIILMTSEQIGAALGYSGDEEQRSRRVRALHERHRDELEPFRLRLKLSQETGTREVTCWRREAVYMFGCFARTERAALFRGWLVQTCDELERGDKVLLSREQFDALLADRDADRGLIACLVAKEEKSASLAGALLADHGHLRRRHPEIFGCPTPQKFFGFYEAELLDDSVA